MICEEKIGKMFIIFINISKNQKTGIFKGSGFSQKVGKKGGK
jgi:hypothetical protein